MSHKLEIGSLTRAIAFDAERASKDETLFLRIVMLREHTNERQISQEKIYWNKNVALMIDQDEVMN